MKSNLASVSVGVAGKMLCDDQGGGCERSRRNVVKTSVDR